MARVKVGKNVYKRGSRFYIRVKGPAGWVEEVTPAATLTEAKRILHERESQAYRQREGLEALPSDSTMALGDLCGWWLKEKCPETSRYRETTRLRKHVIDQPLGKLPLRNVTSEEIERRLRAMQRDEKLSGIYVNGLRTVLTTVYRKARRAGIWTGANPMGDVERCKVVKRAYSVLKAEEVPPFLAGVAADWRDLFACALYTGMRKGELFALPIDEVDLAARTITVARSNDRNTTKGGHADVIPIAPPLLPYLRHAIDTSPSGLVFPRPVYTDGNGIAHPAGEQWPESKKMTPLVRVALKTAGLVVGYNHVCRRCKGRRVAPHAWRHNDAEERRCPTCSMLLWAKPVPRKMRFHDLRHSTATLLLKAGIDPHRVQRIMRHSDVKLTTGTYGHLVVEDLRDAVAALPASKDPCRVAPVWQDEQGSERRKAGTHDLRVEFRPVSLERETGFEPATLSLGS